MNRNFTPAIRARINRGVARAPARAKVDYRVPNDRGGMQTLCVGCGVLLLEDYLDGAGGRVTRVTSNYAEITIGFNDGSKHEHATCRTCRSKLTSADAEWIYAAVLKRFWAMEVANSRDKTRWDVMGLRVPVVLFPYSRVAL